MEIFGIGPLELLFIALLAIIIFGPKDLQKAGRTLGQWLRKLVQSDTWKTVTQASRKIKTLPNDLMREAGMEEVQQTIAPLQAELRKVRAAGRKPADARLIESWIAEPEPPPAAPADPPQEPSK